MSLSTMVRAVNFGWQWLPNPRGGWAMRTRHGTVYDVRYTCGGAMVRERYDEMMKI